MRYIKFFALPLLVSLSFAAQQSVQTQVFPANAGAVTQAAPEAQGTQASQPQNNNIFLEYYAKQGSAFSASVFKQENGALVKRDISYDDLKKTVVIFFGDWCPHCHRFLTDFSKYIGTLTAKGIKIMLLNVPSVERLKTWQDPTSQDYQNALQKVQSYGINPSSGVELVLLGERTTLAKTGVSGLPVFIAVKDAKEYFRGVGDKGVSKLQLSDANVLKQFLEIWGDDSKDSAKDDSVAEKKSTKSPKHKAEKKSSKKSTQRKLSGAPKLSKTAMIESRTATEMLNNIPWKLDLNLDK